MSSVDGTRRNEAGSGERQRATTDAPARATTLPAATGTCAPSAPDGQTTVPHTCAYGITHGNRNTSLAPWGRGGPKAQFAGDENDWTRRAPIAHRHADGPAAERAGEASQPKTRTRTAAWAYAQGTGTWNCQRAAPHGRTAPPLALRQRTMRRWDILPNDAVRPVRRPGRKAANTMRALARARGTLRDFPLRVPQPSCAMGRQGDSASPRQRRRSARPTPGETTGAGTVPSAATTASKRRAGLAFPTGRGQILSPSAQLLPRKFLVQFA
jgi:hypothetical protein